MFAQVSFYLNVAAVMAELPAGGQPELEQFNALLEGQGVYESLSVAD